VPAGNPTVVVNPLGTGASALLATRLAGTAGLIKSGPGTAVLQRPNTLSGPLTVNGGTLRLDPGSVLNTGTGTVTVGVNAGASLQVSGGSFTAGGLATMGSGVAGVFTLDSGEARFAAVRTNSDSGSTYRVNGGAFTATDVNIRRNSAAAVDFGSGFIVAGGTATVGTIELGTNNSNGALTVSGGTLTAGGTITVGNQVTAGRGGALRVTGGTFTSTDAVNGIVLARTNGANANNVASATFGGGVSTVEKLTLGFDATVTAGSASVAVNGGALYLGGGGIVRNGTGTFATTVSLTSGLLGAKASWSTDVAVTFPASGTATITAGDAGGQARDITLAGPLSGAGGFTKAGPGVLSLAGSGTFSGPVAVDSGLLKVDGTIESGEPLTLTGGSLTGSGAVRRAVTLGPGGTIQPGGAAPASILTVGSLRWEGGGTLAVDLSSGKRLAITGALQRAGTGALRVALSASEALPVGARYTLATFASTDVVAHDFVASGPADHRGVFLVGPTSVEFLVTGAGPTAAYTQWAYLVGLPPGQDGPGQDPDDDGIGNLLEFVQGGDPLRPGTQPITALTVEADTHVYPAIAFVRRHDLGGVTAQVRVAPDLAFTTLLDVEEVSAAPRADGADDVLVRSTVPLSEHANQVFRLAATFPAPLAELRSRPVGVMTGGLRRGLAGLSVPLIQADLFVGKASSTTASRLEFPEGAGNLGALLTSGGMYYVELLGGPLEGERFDVDVDATIDAGGATLVLAFGAGSLSTRSALPGTGIVGTRLVLRPHLTLDGLRSLLTPGLVGDDHFVLADAVQILEDGQFQRYSLRADGVTWSRLGSDEDFRGKVLPPDASFLVESKRRDQVFLRAGNVRTSAFRKNLAPGFQAFATGFPIDLSPVQAHAFVDPAVPAAARWTGNNVFALADQIEVILGDPRPFELYYLRGDGSSWRTLTSTTNFATAPILGATSAIVVRRIKPDATYRIAPPFGP
jgi:autotransporter-associated beta strand protein